MKNKRRLTAMLLAGCLTVSSVPVAFAEDAPVQQQEQTTLTPEQQQEQVFALADQAREDSKAAAPTEGTCGENASWKLEGGTLTISGTGEMSNYGSNDAPWYDSRSSITKVVIEDGITSIGNYAFYGCSNLSSVTIPDSVTSIGQNAFEDCSSLSSVTIPTNVTSIGENAFDSSGLSEIYFTGDAPTIGDNVFYGVTATAYYPQDASGWENAIRNQYGGKITWKTKDYGAQEETRKGTCGENVFWELKDGTLTISGKGEMKDYGAQEDVPWYSSIDSIKKVVIGADVSTIGDFSLYGCKNLKSVEMSGIVIIGRFAFSQCTALDNITIPNATVEIKEGAFYHTGLTTIELPNSVENVGKSAFEACPVNKIKLSDHLPEISQYMFADCESITDIAIPDSVSTINRSAFSGCSNLRKIVMGSSISYLLSDQWGAASPFNGCGKLSEIYFTGDAPDIEDTVFNKITATAYYPQNAYGWENVIQEQYGGTITWTPWTPEETPGETPETDGNLITINDTWNQKNFGTEIPVFFHEKLFGVTQGSVMYKEDNGTGGHCYGMVATAISTWNKLPAVKTYNSNYTALNQVEFGDRSSKTNLNAVQFINYAQLSQMLPSIRMEKSRNEDNLQGLCDAVRNYLDKKEDAVHISVNGDAGGMSGGHALLALNMEDKDNESIIKVYDCNYPGTERELHLKKDKDGNFTGWYYDIGHKWNQRWSDSNGFISYTTQAKNLYRDLKRRGIVEESTSKAQAASAQASEADIDSEYKYLITANTDTLTVKDGQYTIKTDGVQSDNTEVLLPIGNGVSPLPDQEEEIDKKSVYNKFWAKTNENMTFSDIQDDSEITVAGEKEGVTAAVPANATVSVQVPEENQAEQKVQISSEANKTVSIEYFGENTNKELESVTVAGSSGGDVESSMIANKVNISGVTDLKITKDDKTVSIDDLDQKSDYQISSDNGDISVKQDSDGDGKYETDIVKPTPDPKPTTPVTEIFSDIYPTAWYIDYVQFVYDNGLMTGTSKTTFEPETTLSRAMVAQVLYNYDKRVDSPYRATNGMQFKDVSKNDWYYEAIQWASANSIASGVGNGYFEPNSPVTREQVAQFLYNYNGRPNVSGSLPFSDADKVSGWAKNAMLWAYQNKIINGTTSSDGGLLLDPQGGATRAQAAAILTNYMKNMM